MVVTRYDRKNVALLTKRFKYAWVDSAGAGPFAEYAVRLVTDRPPTETAAAFRRFLSADKIEVEKRTKKRGINLVDIKPHIDLLSLEAGESETNIFLRLPAGNEFNLNTGVVPDAFSDAFEGRIESVYTTRTKILTKDGENFI